MSEKAIKLIHSPNQQLQNFVTCTGTQELPHGKIVGSRVIFNMIWWLCLVPTSATRFASDVGYRMAKKWIGLCKETIFMNNSLTENGEHDIPSQILKTIFGLHASVIF